MAMHIKYTVRYSVKLADDYGFFLWIRDFCRFVPLRVGIRNPDPYPDPTRKNSLGCDHIRLRNACVIH
jgi:hypothetical protein